MRARRWRTALITAVALVTPLLLGPPAHAQDALIPPRGAWFGSWIKPETGWMRADTEAAVLNLERDLGGTLGIDHHFFPWGTPMPGWQAAWDLQNGRIPMMTWGDVDVADVNAGLHDAYITDRARAMKAVGAPIFLRWMGEMETPPKAANARSPEQWTAAWRRIHGIFAAQGASNVSWVWCPTAYGFANGDALPFYPGDGYVDWTCADGYNWAPGKPTADWRSFQQIFSAFHAWGLEKGKPMMIGETGVQEGDPGAKATWFAEARSSLKTTLTGIRAFVYFSAVAPDSSGRMYDFRVGTSESSTTAFAEMRQDPYFRPLGPDPEAFTPKVSVFRGKVRDKRAPENDRVRLRIRRAGRVSFVLENAGTVEDTLHLRANRSTSRLRLRFSMHGENITRKVLRGTLSLERIAPGERTVIRMIVRGKPRAGGRSVQRVRLSAVSGGNPLVVDSARAVIVVGPR